MGCGVDDCDDASVESVPHSNQADTPGPFGRTVPFNVAVVPVMPEGALVVTIGVVFATTICAVPLAGPLVAVICTEPTETAVTSPDVFTVAAAPLDCHEMARWLV